MPETSGPLKETSQHSPPEGLHLCTDCLRLSLNKVTAARFLLNKCWASFSDVLGGESKVRRELEAFHHLGEATSLVPQGITAREEIPALYFYADGLGATQIKPNSYQRRGLPQSGLLQ